MTILEAYIGGIHNFFSIWFFCLFQITPFFIAYLTGLTMIEIGTEKWKYGISGIISGGLLCLIGFMSGYILLGATATSVSNILFRYISILNQLGGVILLITGLYFTGLFNISTFNLNGKWYRRYVGLLIGFSFALAYQPCVTPTLTSIFNMTKNPETVSRGTLLLSFYSAGISTSFITAGILISGVLSIDSLKSFRKAIQYIGGGLLIIMSGLILLNWMTAYKSYLVGWLIHEH